MRERGYTVARFMPNKIVDEKIISPSSFAPAEYKFQKKSWLSEKCKKIVDRDKLVDFLADVATGRYTEERFFSWNGKMQSRVTPCDISYRIKAIEILLDRGFGKLLNAAAPDTDDISRRIIVRADSLQQNVQINIQQDDTQTPITIPQVTVNQTPQGDAL